jgi:hypothetical protein
MTVRTDIEHVAAILSRGQPEDERLLLRFYGATQKAVSQAHLAKELQISRQAVHAKIGRLLACRSDESLRELTLTARLQHALINDGSISPSLLDGVRQSDAMRFYCDLLGVKPVGHQGKGLPRIPAAQFDALVTAAYGPRRKVLLAAARLILVDGEVLSPVSKFFGVSPSSLWRTCLEVASLHETAAAAYASI